MCLTWRGIAGAKEKFYSLRRNIGAEVKCQKKRSCKITHWEEHMLQKERVTQCGTKMLKGHSESGTDETERKCDSKRVTEDTLGSFIQRNIWNRKKGPLIDRNISCLRITHREEQMKWKDSVTQTGNRRHSRVTQREMHGTERNSH